MPKTKTAPRPPPRGRDETCQALIEAGARLFARHGPDAVSVRDVAAEARVNHSLVFRHFGNKDALVRAIFESMFDNSGPRDPNITGARDRLLASVAALTSNRQLWRLLTYAMLEEKTPLLLSIPSHYMKETLDRFKAAWLGRGYVERFPGSRGVRDTEHGVDIDFVITGHFPGDGKPKAIQFPDPAEVAARGARVALLPLPRLIELKLASGMSAPHRAKDLVDVQELVRHAALPLALAEELDPSVRAKYRELWGFAQVRDDE